MAIELQVPAIGESITTGVIAEWLSAEGDWVGLDDPVVTIETDKVNVDVPAPAAGIIRKILKQAGETVAVGEVIGYLEAAAEAPAPVVVMPAAGRALAASGLTADEVTATGPGHRLLKEDVDRHLTKPEPKPEPEPELVAGEGEDEVVPMTPLRQRVAERLVTAQQTAALLTTFNEVDMSRVIALRRRYQEDFVQRYGVKLGFMSFFIKAAIEALKAYPALNAEIRGGDVVYHHYHDIGVAVGGGKGLVVPVIRNAERLSFAATEQAIADLADRARQSKLKLEELQGGTFTISNGGIYGSLLSTPIVNPPQSGILGLHKIQERPIAVAGEVVVRPMMYLALTYDHRMVDGREAVGFLIHIKHCIEDPTRILLEV